MVDSAKRLKNRLRQCIVYWNSFALVRLENLSLMNLSEYRFEISLSEKWIKGMIKKIKWNNHYSLGNLELDFTKADGSVYNTIILAGENGTGKTTILDTLSDFLNCQSIEPFDYIDYEVHDTDYHIIPDSNNASGGFHKRTLVGRKKYELINRGRYYHGDDIQSDPNDLRYYGYAYSKARSGFQTGQVTSVTTQQVDAEKFEPDQNEDFTHIKQLIIDIEQQDDATWRKETLLGDISDSKYDNFEKFHSKGYRFKKAFNEFFDEIKFAGIDNNNSQEKRVLFEKFGKQIPVDQLSTGEKQIVFRGAHLLKNVNSISDGIVLIDEPELSLHPMWQKKILSYYRGLFTNDGKQSVQMIVATHSEYVLRSALEERDNILVIVLTEKGESVEARRVEAPNALPSITIAETNYLAFNVLTVDYHIELYGYLQVKVNKHTIKECDNYIASSHLYNPTIHEKIDSYNNSTYRTLPTYIRNAIDHPDSGRTYTEEEFKNSIELLIELCK